tara:strand:+ start:1135 stop:1299 length:165 start_codon:yes stop_codon:yes gene_type:complete
MKKFMSSLWKMLSAHEYAPEKHYMRGYAEQHLSESVDLCDLERRQQQLARKGIY